MNYPLSKSLMAQAPHDILRTSLDHLLRRKFFRYPSDIKKPYFFVTPQNFRVNWKNKVITISAFDATISFQRECAGYSIQKITGIYLYSNSAVMVCALRGMGQ
jgi:hypothetical protein